MSLVEITEVAVERPEGVKGASLQAPGASSRRDSHDLNIAGWLVGAERQARSIDILHCGEIVRSMPVAGPRQDVADRYPDLAWAATSGFRAIVGLLGLPRKFQLDLVARFEDGSGARFATIRGWRAALATDYSPVLRPLILTSIGRTGTTWLMRLLIEHPGIIAVARYPYETRIARYWMHSLHVLAQPADHADSSHPIRFHQNRYMTGHNPFYIGYVSERNGLESWFGRSHIEQLATFFQTMVDSFYGQLAEVQQLPAVKWFVEKNLPDHIPPLTWELYPDAREIILVRDFRDMAASMIAFGNKRGRPFGPVPHEGGVEFVRGLRTSALKLQSAWQDRHERALLVRYEDLVTAPQRTVADVLAYLDEDAALAAEMVSGAEADRSALAAHRTATDTAASVGRWRSDLDEVLTAACAEAFDDILPTFGYATTREAMALGEARR